MRRLWNWRCGFVAALAACAVACGRPADAPRNGSRAAGVSVRGLDWPMLGGTPERDLVAPRAKNVPTTWAIGPAPTPDAHTNLKWTAATGSASYGGPVIAGGKVFVGTNNDHPRDPKVKGDKGVVMCFNEADGKFLWQIVHDKLPNPNANDWPNQGVASTPCVDGNRLYYVSNRCELVCADTAGQVAWRLDMMKDLHVYPRYLANSSPLVAGDLVFAVTGNGVGEEDGKVVLPAPDAPSFIAVKKADGKVAWKSHLPGSKIMNGQWSNPVYAVVDGQAQVIFPGGDGVLYAFEPKDGKLLWKFSCNATKWEYKPSGKGRRNYIVATPVVHEGRLYVGMGRDPENEGPGMGDLWCVDLARATHFGPTSRDHDVSPAGENFDPKAPANQKSALGWHYGGAGPKGGVRDYVFGRTLSSCAVQSGLVYAADLDGFVYCFDAATGEKYWDEDLKSSVWGSPLWADGKVYLGDDNGDVHIFSHGKVKKVIGTVAMEEPVQTPPVVANGLLYVMTKSKVYAITNK
jgi:outer membrane protein assembly factor BamB